MYILSAQQMLGFLESDLASKRGGKGDDESLRTTQATQPQSDADVVMQ